MPLEIKGFDELKRALKDLPAVVAGPITEKALTEAAKPIHAAALAKVPVDTGFLKSRLSSRFVKGRDPASSFVSIGTSEADYQGKTFYAAFVEYGHFAGTRRDRIARSVARRLRSEARRARKTGGGLAPKGSAFRSWQEAFFSAEGQRAANAAGARRFVEPRPFLRPAFDENVAQARQIMEDVIARELEKIGGAK